MAYKFQLGAFTASGSLKQEGTLEAETSFTIGNASLTEAELEKLDGITDGTAAANKALVADGNVDISGLRNIGATGEIDGGSFKLGGSEIISSAGNFSGNLFNTGIISASNDISGSDNLKLGGDIIAKNMSSATAVAASDSIVIFDATDSTLKKESISDFADIMTAGVGNGLSAASGVLTLNINELPNVSPDMGNDTIIIGDANDSNNPKETSINLLMAGAAGDGLANSSGILAVQVSGAVHVSSDKVSISGSIAGDGLGYVGGVDSISGLKVNVDDSTIETNNDSLRVKASGIEHSHLNSNIVSGLTDIGASIVATDEFLISDAGTPKRSDISRLGDFLGGDGLAVSSGVLAVAVSGAVHVTSDKVAISGSIAGDGLGYVGGVDSISGLKVNVDDSSIETDSDSLRVKALGITNAMLNGSIADSKLNTITTAGKVALSALEIDGGSDIGAALADADLIIVDDGAGGTNRKAALSRIPTYLVDHSSLNSLTSLAAVGALNAGSITSGFGNINIGNSTGSFGKVVVSGELIVQGDTTFISSSTLMVTQSVSFEGTTGDGFQTKLGVVNPTADRDIKLANIGGFIQPFAAASTTQITATPAEINLLDAAAGSSVAVAAGDGVIIFDANDGNNGKKVLMSDLKSFIAGGTDVTIRTDGQTLQTGVNYYASGALPVSGALPGSPEVGDAVRVKAHEGCDSTKTVKIVTTTGTHRIDGETQLILESPHAAVELVYVDTNIWKVF